MDESNNPTGDLDSLHMPGKPTKNQPDLREKYSPHDPTQCGIVWSDNPDVPKWAVKLMLHTAEPEKVEERYGFVVISTMEKEAEGPESSANNRVVKLNSVHHADAIDTEMFRKFLRKGLPFTRIELAGPFLNNVSICPPKYSIASEVPFVQIINLKTLILRPKITLAVKGEDKSSQDTYYRIHKTFFQNMKGRTAKNLWYLFKSIYSPKLESLQIQDFVDWDDQTEGEEMGIDGLFRYWDKPLGEFIERHSLTLKSLRTSPLPISNVSEYSGPIKPISTIPNLNELYFCPKISTHIDSKPPSKFRGQKGQTATMNFESWLRHEHIGNQLHLWKDILGAQQNLRKVGWICDSWNPYPLNRKDFAKLCENNEHLEAIMLILYGDEKFRKEFRAREEEALPSVNYKDFQINCTMFFGLQSLKSLTVGCCVDDEQRRHFCMYNLNQLPKSLELVHLSGIRISERDMLSLRRLPRLKALTIVQDDLFPQVGDHSPHPSQNEVKEGLTEELMKGLITMRSLDKLVLVGFKLPSSHFRHQNGNDTAAKQGIWNSGESTSERSAGDAGGGFFSFFGMICSACLPLDSSPKKEEPAPQDPDPVEDEDEIRYRQFVEFLKKVGNVTENQKNRKLKEFYYSPASFSVGASEATMSMLPRF